MIEVTRNSNVITKGKLGQLQQQKADVEEVAEGLEAGLRVDFGQPIAPNMFVKEGDILEVYEEERIKKSL